ncbi:MAG: dihydroorotate dehydrogenase [Deltaproteobacteria bacterium]|nr:dihydroorotate dehydrogenase [Deltaproteobacteria bacterium]
MARPVIALARVLEVAPLSSETFVLRLARPRGMPLAEPGQFAKIAPCGPDLPGGWPPPPESVPRACIPDGPSGPCGAGAAFPGPDSPDAADGPRCGGAVYPQSTEPRTLPSSLPATPGYAAGLPEPQAAYQPAATPGFPFLDRPFSIHLMDRDSLSFLIRTVGAGTQFLRELPRGSLVKVTGPIGTGLPTAAPELRNGPVYLVAGGAGLAPMASAARWNPEAVLVYGERTGSSQVDQDYLRSVFHQAVAYTDDGTGYGRRGTVLDGLAECLKERRLPIFACGPPNMLRAVEDLSRRKGVRAWVSTEAFMACGLGVCLSCGVPLKTGRRVRVCVEGPVFPGSEIVHLPDRKAPDRRSFVPDMTVKIGPLILRNPVIAASGTFGYGLELREFCPPERLGAVITKGVSPDPWPGNPQPRAAEGAGGLINSIGLENMGVDRYLAEALPSLKAAGATVGANILGREPQDYPLLARKLADSEADFLELNISCPNLKGGGGMSFGGDPELAGSITRETVKAARGKPVVVKLPPLVSDITLLARRCEDAGASALSLINSLPAMAIDLHARRPKLRNVTGGLSGPPIKPLALRQVCLCARAVSIPVIGMGGIFTAEDALEFILAGASAVQVGTATLRDPRSPVFILEGIEKHLWDIEEDLEHFRGSLVLD